MSDIFKLEHKMKMKEFTEEDKKYYIIPLRLVENEEMKDEVSYRVDHKML